MFKYVCIFIASLSVAFAQQGTPPAADPLEGSQPVVRAYNDLLVEKVKYSALRDEIERKVIANDSSLDASQVEILVAKNMKVAPSESGLRLAMENAEARYDALLRTEARQKTQLLGNEILKQNFVFAVRAMYPRWLKRQAKQAGDQDGEKLMLIRLSNAFKQMKQGGLTITAFRSKPVIHLYNVWPSKRNGAKKAKINSDVTFQKMVISPVDMQLRVVHEGKVRKLIRSTYQIAIYSPDVNKWSFIDGSTMDIKTLRGVFPSLPLTVEKQLPAKTLTEIK